tara:strand:+ start:656 stop:859 length:204 start_codon:yes stop_codon:yes gene_type:complete
MDKEILLLEIEAIGTYLTEYTVDEYRDYTGSVQNAIHSIIDDSIEKHIQRIGDEILSKYQLGYYKES